MEVGGGRGGGREVGRGGWSRRRLVEVEEVVEKWGGEGGVGGGWWR